MHDAGEVLAQSIRRPALAARQRISDRCWSWAAGGRCFSRRGGAATAATSITSASRRAGCTADPLQTAGAFAQIFAGGGMSGTPPSQVRSRRNGNPKVVDALASAGSTRRSWPFTVRRSNCRATSRVAHSAGDRGNRRQIHSEPGIGHPRRGWPAAYTSNRHRRTGAV